MHFAIFSKDAGFLLSICKGWVQETETVPGNLRGRDRHWVLTGLPSSRLGPGDSQDSEELGYQGASNSETVTRAAGSRTYSLPGCQGSGSLNWERVASMMPFSTLENGPTRCYRKLPISTPCLQAKSCTEKVSTSLPASSFCRGAFSWITSHIPTKCCPQLGGGNGEVKQANP